MQGAFPQLLVLDGQNQHARQVHQRADIADTHRSFVVIDEAQIADGENRDGHDDRRQHAQGRDVQLGGLGAALLFHPVYGGKQRTVHQHKQQHGQRVAPGALGPQGTVQLPLHAGGQLGQNKRPGTVIPGFQRGGLAGAPQKQIHRADGGHHAGKPQHQRHRAGQLHKHRQPGHPDQAVDGAASGRIARRQLPGI